MSGNSGTWPSGRLIVLGGARIDRVCPRAAEAAASAALGKEPAVLAELCRLPSAGERRFAARLRRFAAELAQTLTRMSERKTKGIRFRLAGVDYSSARDPPRKKPKMTCPHGIVLLPILFVSVVLLTSCKI